MADILTTDDYINLLQLRFNNSEIKFEKTEFKSLDENLDGYLGDHNSLKITYSLNGSNYNVNFFVKSMPKAESSAIVAKKLLAYEKEIFFYDILMREFEKRGYNVSFAPKVYLCKDNRAMIMEDLKSDGYFLSGRTNFYDLEKMKSSIKSLAYFHGSVLIFEEERSQELGRKFRLDQEYPGEIFEEKYLDVRDKAGVGYNYIYKTKECFEKLIHIFDEDEAWKNSYLQKLNTTDFFEIFDRDLGTRKAIGHGDLWSNNMLFKRKNDQLVCCIVDQQVLRYYDPAFDVLYIIYVNTRKEFRDKHMDPLLDFYYENLKQVLAERNLILENIYSEEDYRKSLKYYEFVAKFGASAAHTLTFLDFNTLKDVLEEKSMTDLINEDRSLLVLEAYNHDKLFREIVRENLYELRDVLMENY